MKRLRTGYSWRLGVPIICAVLLILMALYHQTLVSMVKSWWHVGNFSHGFLIFPISGYLIFRHRHLLENITPSVNPWGLLILIFLEFCWLLAHATSVQVLEQLSLVAMIPALVLTFLGFQVVKTIVFPLGFLIFAVPMGSGLVSTLIEFTTFFTVGALHLTGIPVLWEGPTIAIPTNSFEVAGGCSGTRYLLAAVPLGCVYAYLNYRRLWWRVAFIALTAFLAIFANGVRAYTIVALAHFGSMRLAYGIDHFIHGELFFGIVILLLFGMGALWREPLPDKDNQAPIDGPINPLPREAACHTPTIVFVTITVLLMLGAAPIMAHWLDRDATHTVIDPIQLPPAMGEWSGPLETLDNWKPLFQGADAQIHRVYTHDDGRRVHLFIAYYHQQRQGAELINSKNRLYDDESWSPMSAEPRSVSLKSNSVLSVHETRLRHLSDARRLVWHWYCVDGRETANPYVVKLLEVISRLRRGHQGSAVIAVAVDYGNLRSDEAQTLLGEFLETMAQAIKNVVVDI